MEFVACFFSGSALTIFLFAEARVTDTSVTHEQVPFHHWSIFGNETEGTRKKM